MNNKLRWQRIFSGRHVSFIAFLSFSLIGGTALHAQEEASAENADADLEYLQQFQLGSIVSLPGETMFSLSAPDANLSFWIQVGQTVNGVEAVAYDAETNRLTIGRGDAVHELGLRAGRVRIASDNEPDLSTRQQRREQWQQRREQQRAEWQDFRNRWEAARENSPELREVSEHFREIQSEFRSLRETAGELERGDPQFRELRQRGRELREELELLGEYAAGTLAQHPDFDESDAERIERMLQRGQPQQQQRGRRGGGRN